MAIDTLAGTDTEAPADDLRGQIESAFTEAETPPEVVVRSGTTEITDPTEKAEAAKAIENAKGDHPTDPQRYADGKFKPTKTEAAPEKVEAPVKEIPSKDTAKASTEQPSTAANAPPAGWTAAEKAEWSKLSPVAQAAVSRREAEMSRGGQQWSEEKRRYEASIAPISRLAQSRGIDTAQASQLLARAQTMLDENPVAGLRQIAASYGVDLATLAGQAPAESSRQDSPDIAALVQRAVAPMLAPIQQRIAMEETQRQQSTQDLVNSFANAPGHELFSSVESDLMDLIPGIKARNPSWTHEKILQEAYDRAVYANPETRASVLAQKDAAAEQRRVDEARARTANAKRAGVSVTGSPAGSPAPQAKDSLRAEIEAAFAGG